MLKMDCSVTVVNFLAAFLIGALTETTKALTSDSFKLVSIDFREALLFQSSASSELDCARQCTAVPGCALIVFLEETRECRGHHCMRASGGNGTYTALVWERGNAANPIANVALGKPAAMSSQRSSQYSGAAAVDGIWLDNKCSKTAPGASAPHWWQVDLQASYTVVSVTIDNRDHTSLTGVPSDFDIQIYTEDPQTNPLTTGSLCYQQDDQADPLAVLQCYPTTTPGRFLRITSNATQLRLCEVMVSACFISP